MRAIKDEIETADPALTIEYEVESLLAPFDVVFTIQEDKEARPRHLVVELDGSNHYYELERHLLGRTVLKYRLLDLAQVNYIRIEYHDYLDAQTAQLTVDNAKLISTIKKHLDITKALESTTDCHDIFAKILI